MSEVNSIVPCLWFSDEAEEAAHFYTSIFKNSKILGVARYGEAGHEIHKMLAGSVMTVSFEIDGQQFTALNGGPLFKFNEAISLQVLCDTQDEVDYFWEKLSQGGDPGAQQCGWLKDKFGVSWQVTPRVLLDMISHPTDESSQRVVEAMLQMKKFDIRALSEAYGR